MFGRTTNQRYLLWLALGTVVMALAMAALLVFELAQKKAIQQATSLRSDSLTALVFQFEREFLRYRQALDKATASAQPIDAETLSLRYDILVSRVTLLRESPSTAVLDEKPQFKDLMPKLVTLIAKSDAVMGQVPLDRNQLTTLLELYNALGPDVQALTLVADSEVARLLERQSKAMLDQNALVVALTFAQLLLLLVASGALAMRQKRQEAERAALEQLTEELREAQFKAVAANRGKSQFLANMSHELRTPFNGMMGMLGLLEGTTITPEQADYIKTAQSSANHLLTLLNDILDISALEAGKMNLKPAPLHLPRLLYEVNALMQPHAASKGLEFSIRLLGPVLPWVLADETRVKQILFNLVNNAVKFTERGSVTMSVNHVTKSDGMMEVVFVVKDTGIGMDASALSKLFQRFYQVDSSSTRKFGGTGLGLEISQSLAHMMGGDIAVMSEFGVGSEFTVKLLLPLCDAPSVAFAPDALMPPGPIAPAASLAPVQFVNSVPSDSSLFGVAPPRILVVEDHPINQKLVGVLLDRMGCHVTFCENGQLAVDAVKQQTFDVILMDVNMPVMDGLTATRMIRAMGGNAAKTPIVVFTADVMNEANEMARAAGADDFLGKPVKVERLRETIRKYLQTGPLSN
jgi:signal transduction histidine kinase/ActR/RegA family two-component response regulator